MFRIASDRTHESRSSMHPRFSLLHNEAGQAVDENFLGGNGYIIEVSYSIIFLSIWAVVDNCSTRRRRRMI